MCAVSNPEEEFDASATSLAGLRYSISNLFHKFGHVESVQLGAVINLGLAAIGIVVFLAASGWLSYLGAGFAALNLYPIVEWVLRR